MCCAHLDDMSLHLHNHLVVDITIPALQIEKCCTQRLGGIPRVIVPTLKRRRSGLQS